MATGSEPVHPAAEIFPMMPPDQLQQLADDIQENGQREPCVYWKGFLLDGRNRLAACKLAGVEPDTCEFDDDYEMDPVKYVLSTNLHRRHLDTSQRGMVGARAKSVYSQMAKERQKAGGGDKKSAKAKSLPANLPEAKKADSRDEAAAAVNVSGKTIDFSATVLDKGSPELIAAVDSGEVSVSRAAKIAETVKPARQLEVAKQPVPRSEKTPFDHMCEWWDKSDSAARTRFRLWIDGECS